MASEKPKRVMDVAKPGSAKPDIGNKPMVIGHKKIAGDPMVTDEADKKPSDNKPTTEKPSEEKTSKSSSTKKPKIMPISESEAKADDKVDAPVEPETDNSAENPSSSGTETLADIQDAQPDGAQSKESSQAQDSSAPDSVTDESTADEQPDGVAKKKPDPAQEALEREEHLQKIIKDKTYVVPIKKARSSSSKNMIITLVLIVLIAIVSVALLIDAEVLDLGFTLPFDVL